jgi:hypothetical protein
MLLDTIEANGTVASWFGFSVAAWIVLYMTNNNDLELRQRNSENLKEVVAQVGFYEFALAKGLDVTPIEHEWIFNVFDNAELVELEAIRDICIRLYRVLARTYRISLIRVTDMPRSRFWSQVVLPFAD